jgi:hypothetical protein
MPPARWPRCWRARSHWRAYRHTTLRSITRRAYNQTVSGYVSGQLATQLRIRLEGWSLVCVRAQRRVVTSQCTHSHRCETLQSPTVLHTFANPEKRRGVSVTPYRG